MLEKRELNTSIVCALGETLHTGSTSKLSWNFTATESSAREKGNCLFRKDKSFRALRRLH